MKAVKFALSGKNAFFKKPEVNSYYYFTYSQIHKVALLGLFGAILGYGGYAQKIWAESKKETPFVEEYPEFYERLQQIKVSVVPKNEKGYIPKKIQQFNNTVGYASGEQGGNLIVKEQWLEDPKWEIYVLLDCEEAEKLAEYLEGKKCVYMPYLGKNDHPADIREAQVIELDTARNKQQISSLFPKGAGIIKEPDEEDELDCFKYEEKLPIGLTGSTNHYVYDTFCFTNFPIDFQYGIFYEADGKNIVFY